MSCCFQIGVSTAAFFPGDGQAGRDAQHQMHFQKDRVHCEVERAFNPQDRFDLVGVY